MALSSPRPPYRPKAVEPVHPWRARGRAGLRGGHPERLPGCLTSARWPQLGPAGGAKQNRPGPRRTAPSPRLPPQQPEANGLSSPLVPEAEPAAVTDVVGLQPENGRKTGLRGDSFFPPIPPPAATSGRGCGARGRATGGSYFVTSTPLAPWTHKTLQAKG